MTTLAPPPAEPRELELWLQHAAGLILCRDVRSYARERIATDTTPAERAAAEKAVDDALYGLMMVLDGVTGSLANDTYHVRLNTQVALYRAEADKPCAVVDLAGGDGMCMACHGWLENDFGDKPVVE